MIGPARAVPWIGHAGCWWPDARRPSGSAALHSTTSTLIYSREHRRPLARRSVNVWERSRVPAGVIEKYPA